VAEAGRYIWGNSMRLFLYVVSDYCTDVQFHHYNIDKFTKLIINNSIENIKYVVMNF
jgi:hypothetical protein